jgi:hypothetical protein
VSVNYQCAASIVALLHCIALICTPFLVAVLNLGWSRYSELALVIVLWLLLFSLSQ